MLRKNRADRETLRSTRKGLVPGTCLIPKRKQPNLSTSQLESNILNTQNHPERAEHIDNGDFTHVVLDRLVST